MQITDKQLKRFWSKVNKTPGGCWLWTGNKNPNGYGRICINYTGTLAHRTSYEIFKGEVPEGLVLDHLCRVRNCVNPEHLEIVTDRINILRGTGFSAKNASKTHCPQGHPYDDKNTRINLDKKGKYQSRHCKTCNKQRSQNNRIKAKQLNLA
jgi:hypothetical protein